jgi:hypothetical protein
MTLTIKAATNPYALIEKAKEDRKKFKKQGF